MIQDAICPRHVIAAFEIDISELNEEICRLRVQISEHPNRKGHYNDITLFSGRKNRNVKSLSSHIIAQMEQKGKSTSQT